MQKKIGDLWSIVFLLLPSSEKSYLLESSLPVFLSDERNELVVDVSALRLEEAGPGTQLVEEEQILLPANLPVIPLGGLLLELFPLLHLFVVRETDPVDPLERFGVGLALPVCRRVLGDGH